MYYSNTVVIIIVFIFTPNCPKICIGYDNTVFLETKTRKERDLNQLFTFYLLFPLIVSTIFIVLSLDVFDKGKAIVHGHWSPWSGWSACTKTCGGGEQKRKRECTNPSPSNGGFKCVGAKYKERVCNLKPCEIRKLNSKC